MPHSPEYRALIEDAVDALHALLAQTQVTGAMGLRKELLLLEENLKKDADMRDDIVGDDVKDRRKMWLNTPMTERYHWVLNALGDSAASVTDIYQRMHEQHPEPDFRETCVRALVNHMLKAGELVRRQAPSERGQIRWKYLRPPVSSELQSLQQMLDGAGENA